MAVVQSVTAEPSAGYQLAVVDHDPLRTTIRAVGELDLAARDELLQVLRLQEGGSRRIVNLDLTGVTFLDCSCLGVLVASHRRLLRQHGLLVLTGVDGATARIIRVTGLDAVLFVVPADEDPFEIVPTAHLTERPRVPMQQPSPPTRLDSPLPDADRPGPANLFVVPDQVGEPGVAVARARPHDWRRGKNCR